MESDEELMVLVARGDADALATLVDRHAGRIYTYLARVSGDPVDAEDLLQETWVRVARSARSFERTRRFRPWIYGIASNLARDRERRRRVRARVGFRAEPHPRGLAPLERFDLRRRVARLPDRLRQALVLRYFEGLSEAEMAETLGIPPGTVKSRLHAAIRELRREEWEA